MYTKYSIRCLPLFLAASASAHRSGIDQAQQKAKLPTELIHQYKPITWVENVAIRPNGWLLPITTTSPVLSQLDPTTGTSKLVHDFSAYGNAIQGITEITLDVFALDVLTCNITTLTCTPGSVTTWTVDFCSEFTKHGKVDSGLSVRMIAAFPEAGFLNGMAALDHKTVLIADSFLGGIWSLNVYTGQRRLLFTDKIMNGTADIATGINGARVRPGLLYFTNSARGSVNRIPINSVTGGLAGEAEVIASGLSGPDDLEIDDDAGVAYVCNGAANEVVRVTLNGGQVKPVAQLPGPTSVRWGTSQLGSHSKALDATTVGGLLQYIEGNVTLGGAIYRIDV